MRVDPKTDLAKLASELQRDPVVEWVEPNYLYRVDSTPALPDDPFLHSSGSWGQSFPDLWGLFQIEAPAAWETSQGEGVIVAVVDSGVDVGHPDLAANVWQNPGEVPNNGFDDDANGFVDDVNGWDFTRCAAFPNSQSGCQSKNQGPDVSDPLGHGTHVAGTIAAVGDNGIGIIGVAPRAQVMAVKGVNATGLGANADLAEALVYAAANGATVINASFSGPPSEAIRMAVEYVTRAFDVVVVASAGNNGVPLERGVFPANLPEVLAVGATTHTDAPAEFSNFGGPLDLVAPGGGGNEPPDSQRLDRTILSLLAPGGAIGQVCDIDDELCEEAPWVVSREYVRLSGTSFAAAHVSGVAALVRSHEPEITRREVRQRLLGAADDLGPLGWDDRYGYGRLNARRALEIAAIPVAEITVPENRGKVWERNYPLAVRGSAQSLRAPLRQWCLRIRPQDSHASKTLACGTVDVLSNTLSTIDESTGLDPGKQYVLELSVEDVAGNVAEDRKTFLVPDPQYAVVPAPSPFEGGGAIVALSSDGTRLAVQANQIGANSVVWLYDSASREIGPVAEGMEPYLSPSGGVLAYAGKMPPDPLTDFTVLYAVGAHTYTALDLETHSIFSPVVGPLDAEGKRMVFSSRLDLTGDNPEGHLQAFFFDLPGGPVRRIVRIPGGVPGVNALNDLQISHDGSRGAFLSAADLDPFSSAHGVEQAFLYDDQTQTIRQLSGRAIDPSGFAERLRSSADAGTLAYLAGNDVFVVDVASGRSEKVVDVNLSFNPPALSGNGRWLAFGSAQDLDRRVGNEDLQGEIFLLDLQTREILQVTDTVRNILNPALHAADWTGDTLVLENGGDQNGTDLLPLVSRALRIKAHSGKPTLQVPETISASEGRTTLVSLQAENPDGGPITFYMELTERRPLPLRRLSQVANYALVDLGNGNARAQFTPRHNEAGSYLLRAAAFNETGGVDVKEVTLVIEDTQPEGDANCDGTLGREDVDALIGAIFDPQWRTKCLTADTNDDGRVSADDLLALIKKLAP